jgi:MFS family permease
VGRVFQASFGSAAWIVSFATLVDNIDPESKGRTLSTAVSVATLGIIAGPVASGMLFQLFGYWASWSLPIAISVLDFAARDLMIEKRPLTEEIRGSLPAEPEETTSLLRPESGEYHYTNPVQQTPETEDTKSYGFYRILLTDHRAIAAVINNFMVSSVLSGFDATARLFL